MKGSVCRNVEEEGEDEDLLCMSGEFEDLRATFKRLIKGNMFPKESREEDFCKGTP
jgi:hypothetical protein